MNTNTKAYFESLTNELLAVKDRVRNLIGGRYWPGDGQWKESVIRAILRRYLPNHFGVGSGFVISEVGVSTQIDVIVYDGSGPLLFRDGDFVIVTPDVVTAVIEVKTRVRSQQIPETIKKLSDIAELLRKQHRYPNPFIGLFSFDDEPVDLQHLLCSLREFNGRFGSFEIQCIALGPRQFIRFWHFPPNGPSYTYDRWHAYLLDGTAPGYFIHNVIECMFPKSVVGNDSLWYPVEGKEIHKVGELEKDTQPEK